MKRRTFIQQTSLLAAQLGILPFATAVLEKDLVIGHGDFRYKVEADWGQLDVRKYPVNDCHEMVQDSQGHILLLTNHTHNNVLTYDRNGKLLASWGNNFPGAHGLTLKNEGGEDLLYITDTQLGIVVKTTLSGREILRISNPNRRDNGEQERPFSPTETAIAENGDIYIADGYGSQYIYVFDQQGRLKHEFGGPGEAADRFLNAHGIAIDSRNGNPQLLITAREKNQLKYFSMAGKYLSTIDLPGAYICRPVIHGKQVYLATIWSGDKANNSGFVSILNEQNRLVSAPGGLAPTYTDGQMQPIAQALTLFRHPHDVCVDNDENLYVPQWNAGRIYPMKLHRV